MTAMLILSVIGVGALTHIKANGGVGGIGGGGIYSFIVTFLVTLILGLIVTLIDTITSYD